MGLQKSKITDYTAYLLTMYSLVKSTGNFYFSKH
jgi:hypothetical protein